MLTLKRNLSIWKIYQHATIDELIKHDSRTSSEVYKALKEREIKISRASVIFFLNRLVDDGLASFTKKTGKGGYHRVYKLMDRTWPDFNETVLDIFLLNLGAIFPENERIQKINEVK